MKKKLCFDISAISERIAGGAFILLFPGFFIYHFLVGKRYISPFLGGYFGIISVILLVPLILFGLKRSIINDIGFLLFFCCLFFLIFIPFFNFSIGNPVGYDREMLLWSLGGFVFNLVAFLIGSNINVGKYSKIFLFFIILFFLVVVFNVEESGIFYIKNDAGDFSDYVATYQGFARSIVVVLMIFMASNFEKRILFYLVFFLGVVCLFFNGARTEFALFLISMVCFILVYSIKSLKVAFYSSVSILLALVLMYILFNHIPSSRMLQLFDIGNSSSGLSRKELLFYGWGLILDNPILGNYGGYTSIGGVGSYPHNILSAWVNLGFLGFFIYVLMFFLIWKEVLFGFFKYNHLNEFRVFFVFSLFVTGALLASKDYTYMLVGLLMGFYVQYKKVTTKS